VWLAGGRVVEFKFAFRSKFAGVTISNVEEIVFIGAVVVKLTEVEECIVGVVKLKDEVVSIGGVVLFPGIGVVELCMAGFITGMIKRIKP
jgi:hypothetical protein